LAVTAAALGIASRLVALRLVVRHPLLIARSFGLIAIRVVLRVPVLLALVVLTLMLLTLVPVLIHKTNLRSRSGKPNAAAIQSRR
jgi:protein-S-isoprenylcysteine O-methyltransferase Ste14